MSNNCPCGIEFEIGDSTEVSFDTGQPVTVSKDYEMLINKPQINGVTLSGNLMLNDLFADGIVINGGDADGFG